MKNDYRFLRDFKVTKRIFPDLDYFPADQDKFFKLEGDLPIFDANGILREIFTIRILFSKEYPKGFAKVYEIGKEIPNHIDWHKYKDDQCCLCAIPEELIEQRKCNSILHFIREFTIPFFVNYVHKREYEIYPNGDYPHGDSGTVLWYQEKFPGFENSQIHDLLVQLINGMSLPGPNENCICGSRRKFKKCHSLFCSELRLIPKLDLNKHLISLIRVDSKCQL